MSARKKPDDSPDAPATLADAPAAELPIAEQDHLPEPEQPVTGGSFVRHENNRLERIEHPPVDPEPAVEAVAPEPEPAAPAVEQEG